MKRNFDLVREILLAAEAQDFDKTKSIASEGYSNDEIKYHIKIMEDGGLIKMRQHPNIDAPAPAPVFDGLTWKGHEFLDSIRESGSWSKIKSVLKAKSLGLSYESIKAAVVYTVKESLSG